MVNKSLMDEWLGGLDQTQRHPFLKTLRPLKKIIKNNIMRVFTPNGAAKVELLDWPIVKVCRQFEKKEKRANPAKMT